MKGIYKFNEATNKLKNPDHLFEVFTMRDGERLGLNEITGEGDVFIGVLKELPGDLYSFWFKGFQFKLEILADDTARIF